MHCPVTGSLPTKSLRLRACGTRVWGIPACRAPVSALRRGPSIYLVPWSPELEPIMGAVIVALHVSRQQHSISSTSTTILQTTRFARHGFYNTSSVSADSLPAITSEAPVHPPYHVVDPHTISNPVPATLGSKSCCFYHLESAKYPPARATGHQGWRQRSCACPRASSYTWLVPLDRRTSRGRCADSFDLGPLRRWCRQPHNRCCLRRCSAHPFAYGFQVSTREWELDHRANMFTELSLWTTSQSTVCLVYGSCLTGFLC